MVPFRGFPYGESLGVWRPEDARDNRLCSAVCFDSGTIKVSGRSSFGSADSSHVNSAGEDCG